MASSINASTSGAGGVITTADNTGILNIQTAGTTAITVSASQNTTFAGTVTLPTGTVYPIVSGTAVASTSGTSIDFTGIPSWVKRITVMFNGVSTSGTSLFLLQLGTSGGIQNTGYVSAANYSTTTAGSASGAGFYLTAVVPAAANTFQGAITVTALSSTVYTQTGTIADDGQRVNDSGGAKTITGTLDRVRITTVNGTDTFDAGSINILYE
jgi:hypothetical protein